MQTSSQIIPINIEDEMKKSFISYAMAVIINRALPDVRDGLKPVHRRTLYAMNELGLWPDKPFRKSVRIVGDVLGKYHPHGDSAVYESLVRMAQDFSLRYMLVEGHGNFGSIDGDSAAAMRYTEARMSKMTMEILQDIEKDTVDFYPNFDGTLMQPSVLPARFPNLLVNGSGGIAVGMATNIPPHNLCEVIDGVVALIDNPEITIDELMLHIKGPDFPTAALIMGHQGIFDAYRTGRGRVVMRARAEIEQYTANASRIIVTELPYQVNKARLVEKIAELVHDKKLEGVSGLRDESDRTGMRIVVELKKDVNAQVLLNQLYIHTQMQDTFGVIMLALVGGEPKVLNLKEMIYHYVEHQKDVVVRRTKYDLDQAVAKAHILEGLLIALDHIDEVIKLIRGSETAAEAKEGLMNRFGLSDKQAQAILDMRLQRLTGLERGKIENEFAQLQKTIEYLMGVLQNDQEVLDIIKKEILIIREKFADKRRSEIVPLPDEINLEDIIEEKDVVVTRTHFGYTKRLPADTYKSQRRGGRGIAGQATREEDFVEDIFVTSTHQYIYFFTNRGRVYRLKGYQIPEASRTAKGTAIVNLLQLDGGEKITAAFPVPKESDHSYLVMATRNGIIKKTALTEFENMRKGGLIAIVLREDDELLAVQLTDGQQDLLIGTHKGMAIRFHEDDIRAIGRATQGVRAIRLTKEDKVVNMVVVTKGEDVLVISENGFGKRTLEEDYRAQMRGGKGMKTLNVTEKTGKVAGLQMVNDEEDIILISDGGVIIRMDAATLRSQGRNTQGVTVMRLGEDTKVACVVCTQKTPESEEDETDEETTAEE